MNINTLRQFRHDLYDCFPRAKDALFNVVDALMTETQAQSLPELCWLEMTVIRVTRPHATNKERDPRISWFVWIGDPNADIAQIALGYARRFGQEHGYRFDKQALLWEKPRLRTPEQFERWSQVVAMVHNHLVLGCDLVEAQWRPWENKQQRYTPQHVRRGMSKLLPRLGAPA
jgi:hypothetical protein